TWYGLYLVDAGTGKTLRSFRGHVSVVGAVVPSPDGRYLLSGSADQTVRVWDPDREEPLLSLFPVGDEWVAWTPEGYSACSPGGERLMGWPVSNGPGQLMAFRTDERFRKTLYRPDVIKRLLAEGSTERARARADRERGQQTTRVELEQVLPPQVTI